MFDPPLTITSYQSETRPKEAASVELTWEHFCDGLRSSLEMPCVSPATPEYVPGERCVGHDCRWKRGRAWSPVRLGAGYRLNANVEAVTLVTFDADDVTDAELEALREALNGLEYVLHSTHSHLHAGPGHNNVRAAILPSREMSPEEWPLVWRGAYDAFRFVYHPATPASDTSLKVRARGVDRVCKDLARLFFVPTRPRGAEFLYHRGRGSPVDVDRLLAHGRSLDARVAPAHTFFSPSPVRDFGGLDEPTASAVSTDLADLRAALVAYRRKKASSEEPEDAEHYQILTAILDGTPIAGPGARSATLNRAASLLAFMLPTGTPWEAVAELVRTSVAATAAVEPRSMKRSLPDYMAIFEASYGRGLGRAHAETEARERRRRTDATVESTLLAMAGAPTVPPRAVSAPADTVSGPGALTAFVAATGALNYFQGPLPVPGAAGNTWLGMLKRTADGKVKPCRTNIYVLLTYNPALARYIRWNMVTKDIEVHGGPFYGYPPATFSIALTTWLHWACKLEVPKEHVEDAILQVAKENRYNPVADYLNSLVWDGVPRLDRFFAGSDPVYVQARSTSEDGADRAVHLARIGRKFFVSAVARALMPGCQCDTMLVLEGPEGKGKTSLLRRLFDPWYTVTRLNFDQKDSQMLPSAAWGIELGELAAARRSDDESLKGHLTTTVDKLRPPYGRRLEEFPRCSVLIGTTNDPHWLSVGKGRRRYWPVYVEAVDLDAISRDRDQLWAEAVVRLRGYMDHTGVAVAPERWHLIDGERAEADAEADARVEATFVEEIIAAWWWRMEPDRRPTALTLVSVVEVALKLESAKLVGSGAAAIQKDVKTALERLGFERKRAGAAGARARVWVPSEALLAPSTPAPHLRLVRSPEDVLHDVANAKVAKK